MFGSDIALSSEPYTIPPIGTVDASRQDWLYNFKRNL